MIVRSLIVISLAFGAASAHASDPFSKAAKAGKRSLVDVVPSVPGVGLPRAEPEVVRRELETTPPSELNLRCQGFFAALGQVNRVRKSVTSLADPEKAVDRLQDALVAEAVAAAGEGYSVKQRLALGKEALKAMIPKAKVQLTRFIGLLRAPKAADAQTLANQEAVCSAVLKRVLGK